MIITRSSPSLFISKTAFYRTIKNQLLSFNPPMEPAKRFLTYPVHPRPVLTPTEQEIFSLMRRFVEEEGLKTVLRVAGGWVRDKVP